MDNFLDAVVVDYLNKTPGSSDSLSVACGINAQYPLTVNFVVVQQILALLAEVGLILVTGEKQGWPLYCARTLND